MKQREFIKGVTPEGLAQYAFLNKPETFNGEEVGYSITLRMNDEDTKEFVAMLNGLLDKAKEENGKKWRKEPYMGMHADADGHIVFKFKAKSMVKTRGGETVKRTIPVVDSKCNPMKVSSLGNGTIVRIAYSLSPYWVSSNVNGIGLYLNAVQVVKYVPYTPKKDYGFTVVEGGYEATEEPEEAEEEFVDIDNAEF